jgi:glyoxylate reductase
MKKVYATRKIENIEYWRDYAKENNLFDLSWNEREENLSQAELYRVAKSKDALITMLCDNIDADFLKENNHLMAISNYAVGHNNLDKEAASTYSIPLGNTPDVLTHATAECALTLLLMVSRRTQEAIANVKDGQWKTWEPLQFNGFDLRGRTIGIIGDGRIGQAFAKMAENLWQARILYYPYKERGASEEEFFSECDVISLHCPLNDKSEGLIDSHFIDRMKKPFYFINTARGACHKEDDLLNGLRKGKILGIGLDVTDPEPMQANSPLLKEEGAVILPHIGSATKKTREEMTRLCMKNIEAALSNKRMPHLI